MLDNLLSRLHRLAGTKAGFGGGNVAGVAFFNPGNISGISAKVRIADSSLHPLNDPLRNRLPLGDSSNPVSNRDIRCVLALRTSALRTDLESPYGCGISRSFGAPSRTNKKPGTWPGFVG